MYREENPDNEVIKIDCADEYTGALTKNGQLYVWGKNNQGQLGIGAGIGIDYTESEKFPTLTLKPDNVKFRDFSCGENCMMMMDDHQILYKTGWRIDYTPGIFEISRTVKPKMFFCGNSYYCMVTEDDEIYQNGNLFKLGKNEKTDSDMARVKEVFEGKEIEYVSGKFRVCAALVKSKTETENKI